MGGDAINTMKYISTIPFSELLNWSVQYLIDSNIAFSKAYPMMRIGDFLIRNRSAVTIQDDVKYKRITIRVRNGGVALRDEIMGNDIGTKKQFLVSKGQFILSKIDARNGAMGIIPNELDGAVVTQDFLSYDINKTKVNPLYFVLICTTKQFVTFCKSCSSGTTNRQRVDEAEFLNTKIPVPSLKEQETLVNTYNCKNGEALYLENEANQIDKGIDKFLMQALRIATQQKQKEQEEKYNYLRFVNFVNISEWGTDIIQKKQKRESFKYPIIKIKKLCQLGSGGTPSRSCPQYYKGNIPWVKTGEVINEEILETEEHITEEAIAKSSAKLYPKGSLIIAMYGQGDTRGRTAKLGVDATTNQACAVLYNIDSRIVTTDYLWYYLQWRYHDLRSMASGNNQPNLNAGKINNYDVVVPPMDVQNEIVAYIKEQKTLSKQLKQRAKIMKEVAIEEFENEIYKI